MKKYTLGYTKSNKLLIMARKVAKKEYNLNIKISYKKINPYPEYPKYKNFIFINSRYQEGFRMGVCAPRINAIFISNKLHVDVKTAPCLIWYCCLHEIAHLKSSRGHGERFIKEFKRLRRKYPFKSIL